MMPDNDYMRQMLLSFAASPKDRLCYQNYVTTSPKHQKEHFHALLLEDAGVFQRTSRNCFRITANGYKFIEAIQNDSVWDKVKRKAADIGNSTVPALISISLEMAKESLERILKGE